jgi:tryptophan synthase alpha chain
MNRIDTRFTQLRAEGRCALIPFITAGDPSLEATVPVMHALASAGADVIELGVPFSDPMADGPVIQQSSERALARKAGLAWVLACVRAFRERDASTPVVLMGYLNPVELFGLERFAGEAASAGVDGVLLVDCPPEEAEAVDAVLGAAGVHRIALAAPTTTAERLVLMGQQARGYLYYVSYAGVTGASSLDVEAIRARVTAMRQDLPLPVAVGFGIKDADSARAVSGFADGVVIGSALVSHLAEATNLDDAVARATGFLAPIRAAIG